MAKEKSSKKEPVDIQSFFLTNEISSQIVLDLRESILKELSVRLADKLTEHMMNRVNAGNTQSGCMVCAGNCKGSCRGSCHGTCSSCKGDCTSTCKGDCSGSSIGRGQVPLRDIVTENLTKVTLTTIESIQDALLKEGFPY